MRMMGTVWNTIKRGETGKRGGETKILKRGGSKVGAWKSGGLETPYQLWYFPQFPAIARQMKRIKKWRDKCTNQESVCHHFFLPGISQPPGQDQQSGKQTQTWLRP